jgi:hypothetical protein
MQHDAEIYFLEVIKKNQFIIGKKGKAIPVTGPEGP